MPLVPCYSEKTIYPVDSYYEREVLKRLFALQFEWTQKGGALEIIKRYLILKSIRS